MVRQRHFSGTIWEDQVGYCRALRIGQQIWVSGTSPSDGEGGTFAPGDAYAQTMRCFEIVQQALESVGADLSDVVRTRVYVTDMECWEDIAKAHYELFADHPPVNTMVEIPRLINPDMLVEIEVEAFCDEEPPPAPLTIPPKTTAKTILGRPIQSADYPPMSTYPPTTARELDEGCLD
ncbi:MAG: RidA family protein [Leptolyngbyaceae cyanobacterium SM2_3_12]|nr:RidA family protein [Leptolyngbyaceae cyanobacterium SM2_3_12]